MKGIAAGPLRAEMHAGTLKFSKGAPSRPKLLQKILFKNNCLAQLIL